MQPEITVLLAEDHTVVREGLKAMLEAEPGLRVVGQAENGLQAVEQAKTLRPDVILMDIAMPVLNGLDAMRQVLKILPGTRVVLLSAHSDPAYVARAKELGASGYFLKQTSLAHLASAIREIHDGSTIFATPAPEKPGENPPFPRPSRHKSVSLTLRETQVLQMVAEGRTNRQIAEGLGLSVKTVEKHRQSLMNKLHLHDTAGLTRYAIFKGIVASDIPTTIL